MKLNKKNIILNLTAAFAISACLFTGCSAVSVDDGGAKSVLAAEAGNGNRDIKLSDARNTPAVRVAKALGPCVVGITNKAVARDWFNNPVQTEGVGSGVIFRKDGYIVTNNHVIENANELVVSLSDGRTFNGKIIGADSLTDIAVIKIDADGDLPAATFGDSDNIVVGEPAIAIGNPLGLEFQGSVTVGVISALNRTLEISDRRIKLVQTDAAINPGNSGGALANADGLVIGINSAKIGASGVEGMGFSIPINTVQNVIDELMSKGYVARPFLGVTAFDKQTALRYGYQLNIDKGVYIFRVSLDAAAGKAGLERGDIILRLDDKEVNSVAELRNVISEHKVGDKLKVRYIRDKQEKEVTVTLEEMPRDN